MYNNVIEAKMTDRGTVIHTFNDGTTKKYSAVKAGLSWPTPTSPGYFVILGEEQRSHTKFEGVKQQRGKLILLTEYESQSPFLDDLVPKFSDSCSLYYCSYVYADLREEHKDEADPFREWYYDSGGGGTSLCEGSFIDSFSLGVSLIRKWLDERLLVLPENSIAREQLKKITGPDLEDSPETRFFAVNGLRFVIAAFHKYQPSNLVGWTPNRS